MFGHNFDELKTNSAHESVYRVKNHLKWAGALPATTRRPQRAAI